MKYLYRALLAATLSITVAAAAFATTSTVNPNVPAQNAPLASSPLRANFLAVYNDINALWNAISSGTGITSLTGDVTSTGSGAAVTALSNTATARTDIGLGATSSVTFGNLTLSKNTSALPATQTGTVLQVGNASSVASRVELDAFGATPHFSTVRWNGTPASPTAIQSGDTLGSVNFWGYDGTSAVGPQAAIRCFANQAWSVGSNGSYCDLAVTPNGSNTLTSALVINADGGITTPNAAGGSKGAGTVNAYGLYATATGAANTGYAGYFANSSTGGLALSVNGLSQFNAAAAAANGTLGISGSTFTPDGTLGNNFTITLVHASCPCTLANPVNMPVGASGIIWIIQSSTGSDTIGTWGTQYTAPGGVKPSLSAGANAVDGIAYIKRDSTHVQITSFGLNFQ